MTRLLLLAAIAAFGFGTLHADDCPLTKSKQSIFAKAKPNTATGPTSIVKTAANAGSFRTLLTLLIAADLEDALKGDGPFTVFAPTDEAFAKLPKGTIETLLKSENKETLQAILSYHVVPKKDRFNFENATSGEAYEFKTLAGGKLKITKGDGTLKVNDAKITVPNVACSNGTIQIVDSVLMPPADKKPGNTIPAVATKAGQFKTLLAALTVAELADVLGTEGPFTVFAPTDDAFAKLPKGTVEKLLKEENRKQLVDILKYHVVAGKVLAKELVKAEKSKTLQGGSVLVNIAEGRVVINESKVLTSDVMADNGVIHIIDRVLLPSHQ
jgi:transforming growth factor-beta-induced protein